MSFFDLFRSKKDPQERHRLLTDSLEEIIRRVAAQSGIPRCIRFEDDAYSVAFSGSREDPSLRLDLSITRSSGWDYLTAELDEDLRWGEWEFEDRFEFFDTVVDYIASHMNHRFKRVIETQRHQGVQVREYILNGDGEWELFSDNHVDSRFVGLFVTKSEITEIEMEYHI